jgi:protocatechuate 3,4-dioxygenase beta subunit
MKRPLPLLLPLLGLLALPLLGAGIPVTGRVLTPDGKPAPGVRALLVPELPNFEFARLELAGKSGPAPAASASTGADGSFRLTALEVGMWTVRLEAAGYAPLETVLAPLTEEAELADARLVPGAGLQVKVTDPQGKPAADAWVRVESPRTDSLAREPWQIPLRRTFFTDAGGGVTVPRRADEVLTVWAAAPGYLPARQEKVHGSAVTLRLAAGTPRRIEVRDAQGKPVAGVLVSLADSFWPAGRTAEGGGLDLAVPADGAGLRLAAADGRRLDYRLRAGKPEEKEPAVIVLKSAAPASGKVVVDGTGRPVPGALAWPDRDLGAVVRAGADGTFRLPHLEEDLRVSVAAPGYFGAQGQAAGGRVPTFKLQPRISAGGIVVDEAGHPVAGASVKASPAPNLRGYRSPAAWRSGGFTRSAASGRFKLSRLAAGVAYELHVQGEGLAPARVELPAREAGAAAPDLRIVLHPGRAAFGTVIDARRRPVAGARVALELAAPAELEGRIRQMTAPLQFPDVSTDAAGRFEMKGLPAGTFDLTVRARGFAPLTVPALAIPGGRGRTDLGTVQLAPGASIRGVVSDPRGEPLADVEVRAKGEGRDEISRFLNDDEGGARAFTAADGSFLLEDLAPGVPLDLIATHPGYAPGAAPRVAVPATAPVRIVLSPSSRVSGRVTGPDGKPVAGASVFLDESARGFAGVIREMAGRPSHRGLTDDTGSFSFADVAPGPVGLVADAPRRQRQELKGLEVKPGQDLAGIEIVLPAAAAVEGRVLLADGHPAEGAEVVVAQPARGGAFAFPTLRASADDTGHYRIEGISPGPHTLEAYADGYRRAVRDVDVKDETRGVDFQLDKVRGEVSGRVTDDAGNPVPGATVVLYGLQEDAHSGDSAADGSFRILGVDDGSYRVRAGKPGYTPYRSDREVIVAGGPVTGIEVRLSAGEGTIAGRLTGLEFSQLARVRVWADSQLNPGSVDADGSYRIPHIPPGTWRVSAAVPDTPLRAEGRVTLEPGVSEARLDLQFGGGHELSGVVLRNGEPLAAAGLALARASGAASQQTATDHQGGFRFGGLEDGTYRLRVRTPNGAWHQETVEITGDQTIQVDLRTASLSGRVVDATDSSPVSGAAIVLKSPEGVRSGSYLGDATTDAHGVFHLPEIGEGSWTVQATREGYATAERTVQVEGDSPPGDVELRLDPTEGVTVEALLATGLPPDRIRVAALDGAGHPVAAGVYSTGENGRTRVSNVPPGSWQLLVESVESAPVTVPATVPGPAVRVILPPAGQLRIQVPALAEHPAAAKVVLTGAGGLYRAIAGDGSVRSEWDLDDGSRFLDRVPAGVWQVAARAADGRSWSGTATVTPGGVAVVELR